jgi:hypothetical protein
MLIGRFVSFVFLATTFAALADCGGDPPGSREESVVDAGRDASLDTEPPRIEDVPPTEGGGTRFKPIYFSRSFNDGTKERIFSGRFQDTKTNQPCSLREVGPDVYACLPELGYASNGFADASCTEPVIAVESGGSPHTYAELDTSDWCDSKFVKIESPKRGPVYKRSLTSGECYSVSSNDLVVPVSAMVPPSDFGVFTRKKDTTAFPTERNGTRLVLESWHFSGDDGSFVVNPPRIIDLVEQSEGTIRRAMDRTLRFLPSSRVFVPELASFKSDTTCSTSVIGFSKDPDVCHDDAFRSTAGLVAEPIEQGCNGTRIFRRPPGTPLTTVYFESGSICSSQQVSPSVDAYPSQTLSEIPAETLVEISQTLVPNTRRTISGSLLEARAVVRSSSDGFEMRDRKSTLYLRKYDVPCMVYLRGAGARCEPVIPSEIDGPWFSDAACKQAVIRLTTYGGRMWEHESTSSCTPPPLYGSSSFGYFRRPPGPPLRLATVYLESPLGECLPMDVSHSGDEFLRDDLREEVPRTEFPVVESEETEIAD